jgi:hypothetical protein
LRHSFDLYLLERMNAKSQGNIKQGQAQLSVLSEAC